MEPPIHTPLMHEHVAPSMAAAHPCRWRVWQLCHGHLLKVATTQPHQPHHHSNSSPIGVACMAALPWPPPQSGDHTATPTTPPQQQLTHSGGVYGSSAMATSSKWRPHSHTNHTTTATAHPLGWRVRQLGHDHPLEVPGRDLEGDAHDQKGHDLRMRGRLVLMGGAPATADVSTVRQGVLPPPLCLA